MMERKIVLKKDVMDALEKAGVSKGQTIMVHTSLSRLGYVCGGAQIIIEALLETEMLAAKNRRRLGFISNSRLPMADNSAYLQRMLHLHWGLTLFQGLTSK